MKTTEKLSIHNKQHASLSLLFFFLLLSTAAAQPSPPQSPYPRFSPSMAVIISVLIAALFFMGFFSIYIRHCHTAAAGSVVRGLSMRPRRAAVARGLDRSVVETFPTFSYSEVKEHKMGKGALECAVCLNEFEDDETLRLLPKCDHVFHPECIDAWLESHVTCPVCRANLVEQTGVETDEDRTGGGSGEPRNEEVVVRVDDDGPQRERNPNFELTMRSVRLGFGKLRSHSTGHSLVQPGENLDRFTLRLPEGVRKEVLDRAMLNRTRSLAIGLQREGIRTGRFDRKIELPGLEAKSDRWVFFTRGLSFRSPRVVAERGESSGLKKGGSKSPVKMPSFKCLEPKADGGDENRRLSAQPPV